LPSFLILMLPLLLLSYQDALLVFDIVQFLFLFLIAFIIYRILEGKNLATIGFSCVVALLLPFSTLASWGMSEAYFWQWAEGQDKVLDLLLILLSFYFGFRRKGWWSGIFFGLSFFDPRFSLLAIPLFLTFNKGVLKRASLFALFTFAVANIPILVLPGVFQSFFRMIVSSGATTPLYYYSYIPLSTIVVLIVVMWKDIARAFSVSRNVPLQTQQ